MDIKQEKEKLKKVEVLPSDRTLKYPLIFLLVFTLIS